MIAKKDVKFIINSAYYSSDTGDSLEAFNKSKDFVIGDYYFTKLKIGWQIYCNINKKYFDNIHEFYKNDNDHYFDQSDYLCSYFDIKKIVENNNFNDLILYNEIWEAGVWLYNIEKGEYIEKGDDLKKVIENKLPFRYLTEDYDGGDEIYIHCNIIDGKYKMYIPFEYISKEDLDNVKLSYIMDLT